MLAFLLALPFYLLIVLPFYLLMCFIASMSYLSSKYPNFDKVTDEKCIYTLFNFIFWPLALSCLIIRGLRKIVIYFVKFIIYFSKNSKRLSSEFVLGLSTISRDILKYFWTYIKETINWTFRT